MTETTAVVGVPASPLMTEFVVVMLASLETVMIVSAAAQAVMAVAIVE